MTTDSLLSMQPAVAGLNLGAVSAAATAIPAGEGSEDFLEALVEKIKGLTAAAVGTAQPVPANADGAAQPLPMDEFTAFIEQIKVLAGQAALARTAQGGKDGEAVGNLLPGLETGEGEALPLSTEQLEHLVTQLLGRTAAPVKAQATSAEADAPELPPAGQALLVAAGAKPRTSGTALTEELKASTEATHEKPDAPVSDMVSAALVPPVPVAPQVAEVAAPVAAATPVEAAPILSGGQAGVAKFAAPVQDPGNATEDGGAEVSAADESVVTPAYQAAPTEAESAVAATTIAQVIAPVIAAPGMPAAAEPALPVAATPMASAVASALNRGAQMAGNTPGTASTTDALGHSMDDMALTPELLKLVAAKTAKVEAGGGDEVTTPLTSLTQTLRSGAEASNVSAFAAMSRAWTPDLQQPMQAPQSPQTGGTAMSTPFGRPDWSEDFGERVVWMTGKGLQSAELQLNPQHLGPVEVRINVNQDQASVQFVAHHPAVREAIEAAIPKLREMLGAQQLNLADVSVAQQSFQDPRDYRGAQLAYDQQSQNSAQGSHYPGDSGASDLARPEGENTVVHQSGRGLLNLYV